ncbi:MAG: hypothetical protein PVJ27_08835 [Candidatus Brocadiaceae bacterium]|jgi:hypothetical protein
MVSRAELRIAPAELSPRVLGGPPDSAGAVAAARAAGEYISRKRPALMEVLRLSAEEDQVVIQAEGEAPERALREAEELLLPQRDAEPTGTISVEPSEFTVQVAEEVAERWEEPEILRSEVRYFPLPSCEWFEISAGDLTLTERRITFEPEWQITRETGAGPSGEHLIRLDRLGRFWRGEWWDIPCLILETPQRSYRYGWPSARGAPETLFDVDEWIVYLRRLLERPE